MRRYSLVLATLAAFAPATLFAEPMPQNPQAAAAPANSTRLAYVMVFVSDMKRSVQFYRDQVGLKLRFASPAWSEFETGGAILALHPAGPNNKAGTSEVGVTVQDLNAFYETRKAAGVTFSGPPQPQPYGSPLTEMHDPDGAAISVGGR
jgi:lactoylglutathione lyase